MSEKKISNYAIAKRQRESDGVQRTGANEPLSLKNGDDKRITMCAILEGKLVRNSSRKNEYSLFLNLVG